MNNVHYTVSFFQTKYMMPDSNYPILYLPKPKYRVGYANRMHVGPFFQLINLIKLYKPYHEIPLIKKMKSVTTLNLPISQFKD